ncbi:MAG TPA: SlyX family protein [Polyangiaceae bacterium]|nr:SlyX family protein [Polyangiaceae bacterium]
MGTDDAERLVALEERYAHAEKLLADLDGVLYEQQRAIDRLQARVQRLEQQLGELLPELVQEKPPHY